MRDTVETSRGTETRRPGLTPWLLLFLAPFAALLLLFWRPGAALLDGSASRLDHAAILPGLTVEATPSSLHPLVITSIRSDSPASRHGIAVGDAVVAIDGERIFSLDQARRRLQKDGTDTVALRLMHGRSLRDVRLVRNRADL